jgi:hypothetical protein
VASGWSLFSGEGNQGLSIVKTYPKTMSVANECDQCRYLAMEIIVIVPMGKSKSKHMEDRNKALKELRASEDNPNFKADPILFRKKIIYSCTKGRSVAHTDVCRSYAIGLPLKLEKYDYDY